MTPSIALLIAHPKESEILKLFFQSTSLHVLAVEPNYAGFLQIKNYKPVCIIIEIPNSRLEFINFVQMIYKSNISGKIPIIAYGNHTDRREIDGFFGFGITEYMNRPIKTKELMAHVERFIADGGMAPAAPAAQDVPIKKTDLLLDSSVLTDTKITLVVESIKKLKAFPFTVAKVHQIAQRQDSSVSDLAKVIEVDPVLSSTLLKIANSVVFASGTRRISTIDEAIVRLGFQETKNIAMSSAVIDSMGADTRSRGFSRIEFWRHCMATAVIAEKLAQSAAYPDPDEAFLAGLLHDFGILLLDEYFHDTLNTILERTSAQLHSYHAEEKDLLGFRSNDCAALLFERWKLPDPIIKVLKMVHQPDTTEAESNENRLVSIVCLAENIAKTLRIGRECDSYVKMMNGVRFPCALNEAFHKEIDKQLAICSQFVEAFKTAPQQEDTGKPLSLKVLIVDPSARYFDPVEQYLLRQGARILKEKSVDDISAGKVSVDMLFIHDADHLPVESINTLINCPSEAASGSTPERPYVPAVIFHDSDAFRLPDTVPNTLVAVLRYGFDLQILDYVIPNFQEGVPVEREITAGPPLVNREVKSDGITNNGLTITCRIVEDDIIVLDLTGSLHMNQIFKIRTEFSEILKLQYKYIALNFQYLDMMDSILIGLLVNMHKHISLRKGALFFINVEGNIRETFETVNLHKIITILKDEAEVIRYIRKAASTS